MVSSWFWSFSASCRSKNLVLKLELWATVEQLVSVSIWSESSLWSLFLLTRSHFGENKSSIFVSKTRYPSELSNSNGVMSNSGATVLTINI